MILSRTPYRISLFGGGTDLPAWYLRHGGSVIAAAINKYCYISARYFPPFHETKYRVVWSQIEMRQKSQEIAHPSVRSCIDHLGITRGLEIHHVGGDLPARSGMGSSSSFTVGLLNALYALKGKMISKHDLAAEAIHVEQRLNKETVGSQDQVTAAYGGFNKIEFSPSGEINVIPITISSDRVRQIQSHFMLFYTNIKRTSSDVQQKFVKTMDGKRRQLRIMHDLVDEALDIINSDRNILEFGELMREAWDTKREFSESVSNTEIDNIHARAIKAGALGGKVTGAGGGGFLLLFVEPEKQSAVKAELHEYIHVPIQFDYSGSQIIFASPEADYSAIEIGRVFQPVHAFREYVDSDPLKKGPTDLSGG